MSRTGVFIAAMCEVERVKVEGEVDIFQTIKAMRKKRPHMVYNKVWHIHVVGLLVVTLLVTSSSHCPFALSNVLPLNVDNTLNVLRHSATRNCKQGTPTVTLPRAETPIWPWFHTWYFVYVYVCVTMHCQCELCVVYSPRPLCTFTSQAI